jgi:hypothetical protein
MQLKFYRSNCSATTTIKLWYGTDPPSGTIRQGFHIQTTHTCGTQPVSQTWFGATRQHAAQILPFQLFRHHHHVLRWDWHFRSTLWVPQTISHPNYPHLSQDTTSVADVVRGHSAHAAQIYRSNCHRHHQFTVLRDWLRSTLWYHKTRLSHPKYPHLPSRDATSVADVVQIIGTCSSNSTVPIVPPPPPCAAVGLALQIQPSGTIRLSNLPTPTLGTQPVSQTWFSQFGTCSSNSTVPIV